ncbi:MAG: cation diffusion facilitator family transporter [Alphaproteobacteria bacterium]
MEAGRPAPHTPARAHAHHGAHGHAHGHAHDHAHAPAEYGRAFALGIALNTAFVVVEAVFGVLSNSVALLADAGHNLSDVLTLAIAWVGSSLAKRAPSGRFTYGFRSTSILAALFNAVVLMVAVGGIAWEAARRLASPEPVVETTVIVVAAIGIAINGATALLFAKGRASDINIRGAFLHMAADAAISAGVVVAGIIILVTGWLWLDPAASLVISLVIVVGTWALLRDSVAMSLDAVPAGIDPASVRAFLDQVPGVASVHDLHIWPMSTTETALTAHLVMPAGHPADDVLAEIAHQLHDRHGIAHATIQVETDGTLCKLAPDHVV